MSLHVNIRGQGPDLVLLHGWAMHSGVFDGLLPTLTQHYRVHSIDLPGHGRSAFDSAIGDLQLLADKIQPHVPKHAIVLGWSLGGLLSLKLAQQHELRALVLVSTTPRFVATHDWPQGMGQSVFAQFFSRLQHNLRATVEDFLTLQVRGDSDAVHTLQTLRQTLLETPGDPEALQLALQILRDADERGALSRIDTPALVIAGEYDRIAHPKAGEYLATQMPRAESYQVGRAGHAPFISHSDTFLSAVLSFLAAVSVAEPC